jgi:hypothetical protein
VPMSHEARAQRRKKIFFAMVACVLMVTSKADAAGFLDKLKKTVDGVAKQVDSANELVKTGEDIANTATSTTNDTSPQAPQSQPATTTLPTNNQVPSAAPAPVSRSVPAASSNRPQGNQLGIETITINSVDSATIRPLVLPAFRGEPMMSHLYGRDYEVAWRAHRNLLAISEKDATVDRAKLKAGYLTGEGGGSMGMPDWFNGTLPYEFSWFTMLTQLASSTMTVAARTKYFCPDVPVDCTHNSPIWGGRQADQFRKKRLFNEFIDTELDKYLAMAKQTRREMYIVNAGMNGGHGLGQYDFTKGGYDVRVRMPEATGMNHFASADGYDVSKREAAFYTKYGSFYRIGEADAPAFAKTVKDNGGSLFSVYKVRLVTGRSAYVYGTDNINVTSILYDYQCVSPTIDFYFDKAITKKAFSFPQ